MFRIIFKKFKIFKSVIVFYPVHMMNNFFMIKKSSKIFLHNKTMLKNLFLSVAKRMGRDINVNIPIIVNLSWAFPLRMTRTHPRNTHPDSSLFGKFISTVGNEWLPFTKERLAACTRTKTCSFSSVFLYFKIIIASLASDINKISNAVLASFRSSHINNYNMALLICKQK